MARRAAQLGQAELTIGEEFREALPIGFVDRPAELADELVKRVAQLREALTDADLAAFTDRLVKRCRPEMLDHWDGQPLANSVRQRVGR